MALRWILTLGLMWSVVYGDSPHSQHPPVHTPLGALLGVRLTCQSCPRVVHGFLGVPFAKPPLGSLRFKEPVPVDPWEGVLDATKYQDVCPQDMSFTSGFSRITNSSLALSEDCLYLNIYSPSPEGSKPVLVYIHGGGLALGSGLFNDGTVLSSYQDIVVVTFNYRIGELGTFLVSDDGGVSPGSLGLRDQIQALQWIQSNIRAFGGDPDRVTISGLSAGALSVSWHLVTPAGSRKLFRRAVSHSRYGSEPISTFSFANKLEDYAQLVGCPTSDIKDTGRCLLEAPLDDLIRATDESFMSSQDMVDLRSFQDPALVPTNIRKAYSLTNSTEELELMVGVVSNEGYPISFNFWRQLGSERYLDAATFERFLSQLFKAYYGDHSVLVTKAVMEFYLKDLQQHQQQDQGEGDRPTEDALDEDALMLPFTDIIGDFFGVNQALYEATYHADKSVPVYVYVFDHLVAQKRRERPVWHKGCDHGEDGQLFWGFPFLDTEALAPVVYSEQDEALARLSMEYLGNFVKSGNPNGDGLARWPRFAPESRDYLLMRPAPEQEAGYRREQMDFWNKDIPLLIQGAQARDHQEL